MEAPVIFFDDICVLCSRAVQFILKADRKESFRFASLNSMAFEKVAPLVTAKKIPADSVILFTHGKIYLRSGAALRIAWRLRFPLPLLTAGFILPPFIRNGIYDWIARNRYRWFGKRQDCFLPDAAVRNRFLA